MTIFPRNLARLSHRDNPAGEPVGIASMALDFYVSPNGDLARRGVGAVLEDVVIQVPPYKPKRPSYGVPHEIHTEPVRPGRCRIRSIDELPRGLRVSLEKVAAATGEEAR